RPRLVEGLSRAGVQMRRRGVETGVYLEAIARALRPLESPGARHAFVHTLRSVIDIHGQRVSATDRLELLAQVPTMIIWGGRDRTIPIEHGLLAHETIAGSAFAEIPGAAHFPHLEAPEELARMLAAFFADSEPRWVEDADWGDVVARHSPR